MKAVDETVPTPERDVDKPFLMPVEDVFSITGRGTVATGRSERGVVKLNDEIGIGGIVEAPMRSVVTGIEMCRRLLDQGHAGDNGGILLRGINNEQRKCGMVLCKAGWSDPHSEF